MAAESRQAVIYCWEVGRGVVQIAVVWEQVDCTVESGRKLGDRKSEVVREQDGLN